MFNGSIYYVLTSSHTAFNSIFTSYDGPVKIASVSNNWYIEKMRTSWLLFIRFAFSFIFSHSSYVRFDIIRRILSKFFNIDVVQVMGITDIDDKIIKRSQESDIPFNQLTKVYQDEFFQDMESLNVSTTVQVVAHFLSHQFCPTKKNAALYFWLHANYFLFTLKDSLKKLQAINRIHQE